jgi:hypothetical protein
MRFSKKIYNLKKKKKQSNDIRKKHGHKYQSNPGKLLQITKNLSRQKKLSIKVYIYLI